MDAIAPSLPPTAAEPREPRDVRFMRRCLQGWPLARGKGVLMKLFGPRLRGREFHMEVEPGVLVPARLDDYVILWSFMHGYASDPAVRLSRQLLQPGDVAFDIGANTGLWSLGAARRVGQPGQVHAFEPVPDNHQRFLSNLRLNAISNIMLQRLGLSDKAGTATFYAASNGNSGMGSLAPQQGVDQAIEIALTTLDNYCREQGIERIDWMKIDVEGAELLALRGGAAVLSREHAPALMFEVDDSSAAAFGSSGAAVKSLLRDYGYQIFRYDGRRLHAVDPAAPVAHDDLFAFKPPHFARHELLRQIRA